MTAPSRLPWTWIARAGALAVCAGLAALFFLDLCDLIFDCGCRSLWAGAADHCNVHDPTTPSCPWCVTGRWGTWLPLGVIWAGQAAALLWPGRLSLPWRVALAAVAFFALGGAVGLGFGLATGYPG
ncbi:MAG TPA: hypothetical protein VMV46_09370 [Thermoanaerobaculia bacterium]|nr:hypothetical protein [Thermoanaerobaculia bacterium]